MHVRSARTSPCCCRQQRCTWKQSRARAGCMQALYVSTSGICHCTKEKGSKRNSRRSSGSLALCCARRLRLRQQSGVHGVKRLAQVHGTVGQRIRL